jgi:hypothetical protein
MSTRCCSQVVLKASRGTSDPDTLGAGRPPYTFPSSFDSSHGVLEARSRGPTLEQLWPNRGAASTEGSPGGPHAARPSSPAAQLAGPCPRSTPPALQTSSPASSQHSTPSNSGAMSPAGHTTSQPAGTLAPRGPCGLQRHVSGMRPTRGMGSPTGACDHGGGVQYNIWLHRYNGVHPVPNQQKCHPLAAVTKHWRGVTFLGVRQYTQSSPRLSVH